MTALVVYRVLVITATVLAAAALVVSVLLFLSVDDAQDRNQETLCASGALLIDPPIVQAQGISDEAFYRRLVANRRFVSDLKDEDCHDVDGSGNRVNSATVRERVGEIDDLIAELSETVPAARRRQDRREMNRPRDGAGADAGETTPPTESAAGASDPSESVAPTETTPPTETAPPAPATPAPASPSPGGSSGGGGSPGAGGSGPGTGQPEQPAPTPPPERGGLGGVLDETTDTTCRLAPALC